MSRVISLGKVNGLSSYELAVQSGTFTGTLSEYINKEQETFNNMIKYCDATKDELQNIVAGINNDISDTKTYVDTRLSNLIGASPETLDTLEEIGVAIQNNTDTITILNEAIGNKANKTDVNNSIATINGEISKIKDSITTANNSITTINNNISDITEVKEFIFQGWHGTQSWGYALKYGRVVYLYITGYTDKDFAVNTAYKISNFPKDWMPMGQKFFSATLSDYNPSGVHISAYFDWDNECFCILSPVTLTAGCLLRFSFTYIAVS